MSSKSRRLYTEKTSKVVLLPIALAISVVQLIVFMKIDWLSELVKNNWYGDDYYADFFSYYKSKWVIIFTVAAIVFFLVYSLVKGFKFNKSFLYIPAAAYALLIIISTVTSEHKEVALNGFVARYEGMWVLLCYLILMVITFNLVKDESQIKFLLGVLLISAAIIALIGTFQFFDMDIFRTDLGKLAILPKEFKASREGLEFTFAESNVYSTFSNPNYVGSYVALLLPIAFVAFLVFKKIYMKIAAGLLMIILLISLIGSRSSAGIVGVIFSGILALIIFRKEIFKRKWIPITVAAGVIIAFVGVNLATGGAVVSRIKGEVKNAFDGAPSFDLQDIIFKDNSVAIVTGTETLVIEIDEEGKLQCYDTNHHNIETRIVEREKDYVIRFLDTRYGEMYRYLIVEGPLIKVYSKHTSFNLYALDDDTFRLVGLRGELINKVEKPETLGFTDKEKIGSSRGYIWSRTIPLLKDSFIKGFGPDNFAIAFPQDDYIGKIRAFSGGANMIVDKPHNMYLQIATNTGILSLIAFLALAGIYAIQSFITYVKIEKNFMTYAGAGIFLAICGYLVTSFFNDSVVGIAPIFWVLLGLGFICNKMVRNQNASV